jgi:hypothetical protein
MDGDENIYTETQECLPKEKFKRVGEKKLSKLPKLYYSFLCSVGKRENKVDIQIDMTGVDERKETG